MTSAIHGGAVGPALFRPVRLAELTLGNRIVVSPMCQYTAVDGVANDWHLQHLASLSMSGAALVVIEANDVEPEGAFTKGCLALHTDASENALARIVDVCHQRGTAAIGLQLTHGGRKAACNVPWEGGGRPLSEAEGRWPTVAPSDIPYGPGWSVPDAYDLAGLARTRNAFAGAARRAARAGVDSLELHGAHGYLLHQFLTPLTNQRTDIYGGSPEKRMRFPLEVFRAVRDVWPAGKPLGVRISGNDWVEGGQTPDDAVAFASALKSLGCDFVCVSGGGLVPNASIKVGPAYQVPFAAKVRAETGLPVRAVGLISRAKQAEEIVASGQADMVALARAFLDDPRWGWHAAAELGATIAYPRQYERCHHSLWPGSKHFVAGDAYYQTARFLPRGLGS
jgi:2,4-dienoyl-CoA reductase-like NADH-dependent reductase (Old Yellow Enzyme family)